MPLLPSRNLVPVTFHVLQSKTTFRERFIETFNQEKYDTVIAYHIRLSLLYRDMHLASRKLDYKEQSCDYRVVV